jgi:catechol 2,3-dioxygenase-like lactoylglutathione lyase family enzyme
MRSTSLFATVTLLLSSVSASPSTGNAQVPMNAQVMGLGIPVSDTKRSIEFYTKTLGLGLHQAAPTMDFLIYKETILEFSPGATNAKAPGSNIVLLQYPNNVTRHGDESGKVVFYVDSVSEMLASVNKKKVPTMLDFGELAMIKDPDGFVIEFLQRKAPKV